MASQPSCPSSLNPHEFLAFKTLMSGLATRWVSILVELGSTNLNWSSESTLVLLNHLALQCGPASEQNDPFRLIHVVFRDAHFVQQLLSQVNARLSTLAALASWRESHLMGITITLALRAFDLADAAGLGAEIRAQALASVLKARRICVDWFRILQEEIQATSDGGAAHQLQQRALAAALLCRRTFVVHLGQTTPLDPLTLGAYVESGIAIHENVGTNIRSLPCILLEDLISTIKLSSRLKTLAFLSVQESQEGFHDALKRFWPGADRTGTANSTITLEQGCWVRYDIPETEVENHQVVHFDLTLGTLLVNGKPVGVGLAIRVPAVLDFVLTTWSFRNFPKIPNMR
jgi:hypothetical protein